MREQCRYGAVQCHVGQVVAPWLQATQGIVDAKGECTEWPIGLVAAAVCEQCTPEIIVEHVGPWRLGKQVLVGFDSTAGK